MGSVKVVILPYKLEFTADDNATLLEILREHGITVDAACGGRGLCGRCKIRVIKGSVSSPTLAERKLLGRQLEEGWRLACQVIPKGDLVIEIPSFRGQILEWAPRLKLRISPGIIAIPLGKLQRALPSNLSTVLKELLSRGVNVSSTSLQALRRLTEFIGKQTFYVIIDSEDMQVLDFKTEGECYGLAIDLGTTTVVVSLVNLQTGEILGTLSEYNAQLAYGRDIISRISYVMRVPKGMAELRRSLIDTINNLVEELLARHRIPADAIYEVAAAGNTVMSCFFLGIPPINLGTSPFEPPFLGGLKVSNYEVGVKANREARIHLLPILGGYVGGDVAGDIISSGMLNNEIAMLVDLGTNGEVVVKVSNRLYVASCAAGPAFEGVGISSGMMAVEGAIERVSIDESLEPKYSVIGNVRPKGICGSGLIDLLASLIKVRVLDAKGRLLELESPRIRRREGILEYVVEWAKNTSSGNDIIITQRDIRKLQLAKAAVKAAWTILLRRAGISVEMLEAVYVAGGFGNFLNPENAVLLGLIPPVDPKKVHFIGNGSLAGSRMYLLSTEVRRSMRRLLKHIVHVELNQEPDFQRLYIKSLDFD